MNPVSIYSDWSVWSAQAVSNTDTYADGFAASQDPSVTGAVMILSVYTENGFWGPSGITYGGTSTVFEGQGTGDGPLMLFFDLDANPPADGSLVGLQGPFGAVSQTWSATVYSNVDNTQIPFAVVQSATNAATLVCDLVPGGYFASNPGYAVALGVRASTDSGSPTVGRTTGFSSQTSLSFSGGIGPVLVGSMIPTSGDPTFTCTATDASNLLEADAYILVPPVAPPVVPDVTVYGKFRPQQAFPPVVSANSGTIPNRVYVPIEDRTVRTK